jgi:heme-degrading monooxygenase HmoA
MDSISTAGLMKLIRVTLRPGHRERYLQSQAVWNRESRLASGYLGEITGDADPDEIYVVTFWRSRRDYEQWMDRDHDRVAALAGAAAHYEALDIRVIDSIEGVQ